MLAMAVSGTRLKFPRSYSVCAHFYTVPVLWMTSCFHVTERMDQNQLFRRVRHVAALVATATLPPPTVISVSQSLQTTFKDWRTCGKKPWCKFRKNRQRDSLSLPVGVFIFRNCVQFSVCWTPVLYVPTLTHVSHSFTCKIAPCLPLLPSRRASPPFDWYSFYRLMEGRRLSRPGWFVTYRNKVPPPEVEPGHGHPSQY